MKNRFTLSVTAFLSLLIFSNITYAQEFKGRLEWVDKAEMRVVDSGVIEKVNVKLGQHVNKGDLLLRMDQRAAQAELLRSKAAVARAELNMEDAERELVRTQDLFERGLIAIEELKDAELKQAVAKAEKESAKASEIAAQVTLEHTEIRAPFDGIIIEKNAWPGGVIYKTLQQAPPLAIAPNNQMLARVLVTAHVLRQYKIGQKATVNVHGVIHNAKIYSMGVEAVRIEPEGAVYEMDLIFKRKNNEVLRPSESVMINLP